MPWQSRIESERVRRLVLAGVMVALLGACTALAAWLSWEQPDPLFPPDPQPSVGMVGVYRFVVPAEFASAGPANPNDWRFQDRRGEGGRHLRVAALTSSPPRMQVHPLVALRTAERLLAPVARANDQLADAGQVAGVTYLLMLGSTQANAGGRERPWDTVLGVSTIDNVHYLAVVLNRDGRVRRADVEAVRSILQSIEPAPGALTRRDRPGRFDADPARGEPLEVG